MKKKKITQETHNLIHRFLKAKLQSKLSIIIPIVFMISDALTIYSPIRDLNFMDYRVSMFITGIIAIVINGTPMVISDHMQRYRENSRKGKQAEARENIIWMIGLTVMLIFIFALLFWLRWVGRSDLYSESHIDIFNDSMSSEYVTTQGEDGMTIFLGLMPIATSVFIFAITNKLSIAEKKAILTEMELVSAETEEIRFKLIKQEAEEGSKIDFSTYDEQVYLLYKDIIDTESKIAKIEDDIARQQVAMDPDSVSHIMKGREAINAAQ